MLKKTPPPVFNYIVGFYDLLGQRAALRGQGMLKLPFTSQADEDAFKTALKASIKPIVNVQQRAAKITLGMLRHKRDSP